MAPFFFVHFEDSSFSDKGIPETVDNSLHLFCSRGFSNKFSSVAVSQIANFFDLPGSYQNEEFTVLHFAFFLFSVLFFISMACSCKEKAFKGGYKYFAIGNYGTCYGGKDQAAYERMLKASGDVADDCLSGNFYEECSADNTKECSGGVDSVFVYSFKAFIPTQPTRK